MFLSSAERCGANQSKISSAYAGPHSMCQVINRSPSGLLGTEVTCSILSLTQQNTMLNPKIHYKSNNYSNNNYISQLLMAYFVVVDGEFLCNCVNILVNHTHAHAHT